VSQGRSVGEMSEERERKRSRFQSGPQGCRGSDAIWDGSDAMDLKLQETK